MDNNYFDINNDSNLIDEVSVENNSFLLLSAHRKDYFNKFSEKLSSNNDEYQGYILSELFFSEANVEIIQRQLVLAVYNESSRKFLIPFQNPKSIEVVMKYIFNENARHLPYDITNQIRELNLKVVDELSPMIIKMYFKRKIFRILMVHHLSMNYLLTSIQRVIRHYQAIHLLFNIYFINFNKFLKYLIDFIISNSFHLI